MNRLASFPIVARELLVASRKPGTFWSRSAIVFVGITGILFWIPAGQINSNTPSSQLGASLFALCSFSMLLFCLFAGPSFTADCLSVEKREGTLGLLFLTDLKAGDVVLGKLAASSINSIYWLLGFFPLLAICFLMGGVEGTQYARTLLTLACILFFSLNAGLFASAVCTEGRKATGLAIALILLISLMPIVLMLSLMTALNSTSDDSLLTFLGLLSPLFEALFIFGRQGPPRSEYFWLGDGITILYGLFFFQWACRLAPRSARQRSPRPVWSRLRDWGMLFTAGSRREQLAWRRSSLDKNAYFWLAAREKHRSRLLWLYFIALAVIWWRGGQAFGYHYWLDWPNFIVTTLLVQATFKTWVAVQSARQFTEDRRTGAVELLLSTPLSVKDLARGQWMALRAQFLGPFLVTILLEAILFQQCTNGFGRGPNEWLVLGVNFLIFPLDIWALAWVGMARASLVRNAKSPAATAVARILCLPWILFGLAFTVLEYLGLDRTRNATGWHPPSASALILGWTVLSIAIALMFGASARFRFFKHFRRAASGRFQTGQETPSRPVKKAATPPK